jgi:uncharacterized membrane protein
LVTSLVVAAVLMTTGLIIWTATNHATARAVTPGSLFSTIDTGNRLMLGGIVLVAITPALLVVALLVLWLRERAWRFAATSALVIILLGIALWVGRG